MSCEYELIRENNIKENRRILAELGLLGPYRENGNDQSPVKVKFPVKRRSRKSVRPVTPRLKTLVNGSEENISPDNCRTLRRSPRLTGKTPKAEEEILVWAEDLSEDDSPKGVTPRKFPRYSDNTFGAIPCIPVGTVFMTRLEASHAGVHRPTVAGIHGSANEGCYSLALSGGYEDDADCGHCFTYTGAGGRDLRGTTASPKNLRTAPQSKDQTLTLGNLALTKNIEMQRPVRVLRGYKLKSHYAPVKGYRYDGLYSVLKFWAATGKSGFKVYKYALQRCKDQEAAPWENTPDSEVAESCLDDQKSSDLETDRGKTLSLVESCPDDQKSGDGDMEADSGKAMSLVESQKSSDGDMETDSEKAMLLVESQKSSNGDMETDSEMAMLFESQKSSDSYMETDSGKTSSSAELF